MKKALLAASVSLFAAAAQADDIYRVEAHLAVNGKEVAVYSDEIPAGATGHFSKTLKLPSLQVKLKDEAVEAPETGLTFTATPSTTSDGPTLVSYTMSYTTQKASASEKDDALPVYRNIATAGSFYVTDKVPQIASGGTATETWVLTVNANKL